MRCGVGCDTKKKEGRVGELDRGRGGGSHGQSRHRSRDIRGDGGRIKTIGRKGVGGGIPRSRRPVCGLRS